MRQVASQANSAGRYDAVIHNAGVGYREPRRIPTDDGLEHVFAINVLAPYVLAFAVARLWTDVLSNAVEPGWVPTRMGGPGAPMTCHSHR